jgi:hypothetical protein
VTNEDNLQRPPYELNGIKMREKLSSRETKLLAFQGLCSMELIEQ